MSGNSGRRGNVALLAGSILVALLLAEGVLRIFPTWFIYASMRNVVQRDCTRPHPTIQFVNRENYQGVFSNREFRTTIKINSKGLRDKEYSYAKPADRKRCLALGDSFVFGWGVEAEQAVPKLMEAKLPGVDVINAGCSGWNTEQELLFLEEEGVRYDPDVVLLFFCENDPYENFFHYTFTEGKLALVGPPGGALQGVRRWLARRSALWNLLRQAAGSPVEEWGPDVLAPGKPLWEQEEKYLADLHDFCLSHPIHLAIVYVPYKGKKGQPRHGGWFASLKSTCERLRIPLVDLVPVMSGADQKQPVFFRFDDHWNSHGHQVAGRVLLRFLRDEGWLEPGMSEPGDSHRVSSEPRGDR